MFWGPPNKVDLFESDVESDTHSRVGRHDIATQSKTATPKSDKLGVSFKKTKKEKKIFLNWVFQ